MREPLPEEPLYTVKIDGQKRQVPLSEITASYQMREAAQNRLDQANVVLGRVGEVEQGGGRTCRRGRSARGYVGGTGRRGRR